MKIEVHLQGGLRKIIDITPGATVGATIGRNVFNADGTLYVPPSSGDSPKLSITSWELILNIPPNVNALANTATTGLYVVTGLGTSATREIESVSGETTVTNGDGVSGNPAVGLADVTPSAGGTLQKYGFDAKGRRSQQGAATTSDLTEGSNLYFTDERAQDAVGATLTDTDTINLNYDDALGEISADLTDESLNAPRQLIYGQQYLYAFHNKLIAGTSAKMTFSGDSTTEGGGTGATGNFIISTAMLEEGRERGHKLTSVNAGHAGEDTADWVSTYIAIDMASPPDLYVVRWGLNDPLAGRTAADVEASLRAGLTTIRASYSVAQMSILLMVPNTANDPPNGRTEAWVRSLRPIIRQVAEDFQCAFFDTFTLWPDAVNAAGRWMDNPFGDGRAIHPLNVMNSWIVSELTPLIFPQYLDVPRWGTYTPTLTNGANVAGSTASQLQWSRTGNVVTVSGRVDIACTAAANTLTILGMSLPIPSNLTAAGNLAGGGAIGQTTYQTFICLGDVANDRATMQFLSNGTTSAAAFFSFTYLVQ